MPIVIKPANARDRAVWSALLDLAESTDGWTLIGARMVELHAAERGQVVPRVSLDADALADARDRLGTQRVARALRRADFDLDAPTVMGVGHVFRKGPIEIDLLAPDGLNSKARRLTVPPAHTVEVPGGTQALRRTEVVPVRLGSRVGRLPRPNLLGAILVKVRAVDVSDAPDDQRSDLALLLSLVDDRGGLARELVGRERSWIRRRVEMNDPGAPCWRSLDEGARQSGLATLRALAEFRHDS